jgi:hypothetical protein
MAKRAKHAVMPPEVSPLHEVHCVAAGHDDQWEAFCLDLDLAVQGNSFEEVRNSLNKAINVYVKSASAQPEPDRTRLLHRKAPVLVRLRWVLLALWPRWGRHNARFTITCHA